MNKVSTAILFAAALLFFSSDNSYASQKPEYKLQPTDVLYITVHQHPDLTTRTRITQDGYISFPLLGRVGVKGLTAQELENKLKEFLEKDYLVDAQCIVFIEEYHPRQVSVMGEVNKPGKYDMSAEKDITVMEAIALAGGFTKDADINGTRVIRIKEDGAKETVHIRVKNITDKGQKDEDIILRPEDIVYVPESFF